MASRILVTSTDLMMIQFLLPHVLYHRQQGYEVEVACSEVGGRLAEVRDKLGASSVHQVHLTRSPFRLGNLRGYKELQRLLNTNHYDLVWTNEPVMGIMTRLAARNARNQGTRVVYMTHGYHFFNGCSPWLWLFYPIEKFASRFCDAIVTISQEDYLRTQKNFHTQMVYHIHGIGVDESRFTHTTNKTEMRKCLDLPENAFVVLSVGELKPHKNHAVIIRALASIKRKDIVYLICGKGELLEKLQRLANELNIGEQVRFLGYRRDIPDILQCADLFAFPSTREGLGLAALEAMFAGLPVVASRIRGIVDYVVDDEIGYTCSPNDIQGFAKAIEKLADDGRLLRKLGDNARKSAQDYSLSRSLVDVKRILEEVIAR